MASVTFVIGITAAGKTHFIDEHFRNLNLDILNVYDYQQKVFSEVGYNDYISVYDQIKYLMDANNRLLSDIINRLIDGRSVVVEHTLLKAKRRVAYIDEIRRRLDSNVNIYIYFINPSEERWKENLKKRKLLNMFDKYKGMLSEIEFPNVEEGFDLIYEVVDEDIRLSYNEPDMTIVQRAKQELLEEKKRIDVENKKKEDRKKLIASMNFRPFWHYCEVCGKREYIKATEAFKDGWDYPPYIGNFGMISPRTCGNCGIDKTLFWKIQTQKGTLVDFEGSLSEDELVTLKRIKAEPFSLL